MNPLSALLVCVALAVPPQDPNPAAGTWILQVSGDATQLTVRNAALKNYQLRPTRETSDYRIRVLDAQGEELANVPLDLSKFCLEADHVGAKPHVRGDVTYEHKVECLVKVPAFATASVVRIEHVQDEKKPAHLLGEVQASEIRKLTAATDARIRKARSEAKAKEAKQKKAANQSKGGR